MIKHDLLAAKRTLLRHRGYALLNLSGLVIGLASAMVLAMYVEAEMSYDRSSPHAASLYRVTTTKRVEEQVTTFATTVPALGPALEAQVPEIKAQTRILVEATESNEALLASGTDRFYEDRFAWSDASLFDVFSLPFVEGDPHTALSRPFTLVIDQQTARRYFGSGSALGKILRWNNTLDLEVTGVMADMPARSHFHFSMIGALATFDGLGASGMIDNWGYQAFYTYVMLEKGGNEEIIAQKASQVARAAGPAVSIALQPITRIHLTSHLEEEIETNGHMQLVYLLGSMAIIVLLIAGINFVNLSIARAVGRRREVGIRKVVGAHRNQLIRQFLIEAAVLVGAGFLIALLVATLVVRAPLQWLTSIPLTMSWHLIMLIAATAAGTALLAGAFPALYLASFSPTMVLYRRKRASRAAPFAKSWLVVLQFALSMTLMVMATVVYQQLRYLRTTDLGLDREHTIAFPLHVVFGQQQLSYEALKEALLRVPGAAHITGTSQLPSRVFAKNWSVRPEGIKTAVSVPITRFDVDEDAITALGLSLSSGSDFAGGPGRRSTGLIINETAARQFGWEAPLGKAFYRDDGSVAGTVIGVVRDFNYESMRRPIAPIVFRMAEAGAYQFVLVRLASSDRAQTLDAIRNVWAASAPAWPFTYFFLDDAFAGLYRSVEQTSRAALLFSLIAIFVACLGLIGLAALSVERRTRELGIRKAVGATRGDIAWLFMRDFLLLAIIAVITASPIALLAARSWLADFAFRIEIDPGVFIQCGLLVCAAALITVGTYVWLALRKDPIDALRCE